MKTIQEYIELLAARNEQIRELQERISELETELNKQEIELLKSILLFRNHLNISIDTSILS